MIMNYFGVEKDNYNLEKKENYTIKLLFAIKCCCYYFEESYSVNYRVFISYGDRVSLEIWCIKNKL